MPASPHPEPGWTVAADRAGSQVEAVRDDPAGRVTLMTALYEEPAATGPSGPPGGRLPYRRAALAFMAWQNRRGLLDPDSGSHWWRAIGEDLLRDTAEARALESGYHGAPSNPAVSLGVDFIRRPSSGSWYRAHNASIVAAYLRHIQLAGEEGRAERFFMNLVLVRVLYAHALVAAPRLALGWCGPLAPVLGDPRLGMTGIFLSLSRVLPDRYPLRGDLRDYIAEEHGFGRLLDLGVIEPRVVELFDWSAETLGIPELRDLVVGGVPAYAWDAADVDPWHQEPTVLARWARRVIPAGRRPPVAPHPRRSR